MLVEPETLAPRVLPACPALSSHCRWVLLSSQNQASPPPPLFFLLHGDILNYGFRNWPYAGDSEFLSHLGYSLSTTLQPPSPGQLLQATIQEMQTNPGPPGTPVPSPSVTQSINQSNTNPHPHPRRPHLVLYPVVKSWISGVMLNPLYPSPPDIIHEASPIDFTS